MNRVKLEIKQTIYFILMTIFTLVGLSLIFIELTDNENTLIVTKLCGLISTIVGHRIYAKHFKTEL